MLPTRRARLQSVIQQELSQIANRELKDPRIPTVTFTAVEVTQDADQATVWVSILGGANRDSRGNELDQEAAKKRMADCLTGLASASGYMRRHLATVLDIRHIPNLVFREDRGLENASRVYELLNTITRADETSSVQTETVAHQVAESSAFAEPSDVAPDSDVELPSDLEETLKKSREKSQTKFAKKREKKQKADSSDNSRD